jgi:hypothetical protein
MMNSHESKRAVPVVRCFDTQGMADRLSSLHRLEEMHPERRSGEICQLEPEERILAEKYFRRHKERRADFLRMLLKEYSDRN